MRTPISFQQYNSNKLVKYGLLLKAINETRYSLLLLIVVKKIVDHLESIVSLVGHNISLDRLHTSTPLALWLYQKNITFLGTMQINRKGNPTEIKNVKQREPFSSDIFWQKDGPLLLSLYVVKSSTGKKECPFVVNSCANIGYHKR